MKKRGVFPLVARSVLHVINVTSKGVGGDELRKLEVSPGRPPSSPSRVYVAVLLRFSDCHISYFGVPLAMLGNAVPWAILHTTVFTPPGIWQVNEAAPTACGVRAPWKDMMSCSKLDRVACVCMVCT